MATLIRLLVENFTFEKSILKCILVNYNPIYKCIATYELLMKIGLIYLFHRVPNYITRRTLHNTNSVLNEQYNTRITALSLDYPTPVRSTYKRFNDIKLRSTRYFILSVQLIFEQLQRTSCSSSVHLFSHNAIAQQPVVRLKLCIIHWFISFPIPTETWSYGGIKRLGVYAGPSNCRLEFNVCSKRIP